MLNLEKKVKGSNELISLEFKTIEGKECVKLLEDELIAYSHEVIYLVNNQHYVSAVTFFKYNGCGAVTLVTIINGMLHLYMPMADSNVLRNIKKYCDSYIVRPIDGYTEDGCPTGPELMIELY